MPRNILLAAAIFAAGIIGLGGYYLVTRPGPQPEAAVPAAILETPAAGAVEGDAPGPYLAITVAGEATGEITIDLFEQTAPNHVAQILALAAAGAYDGVVFHRVIDGFMAQTGDVQFGRADGDTVRAGTGGSDRPDLAAEFSDLPFDRGVVGMARSQDPDSANSQFFIMFADGHFLNNQYTVVGRVSDGLDVLDAIKRGHPQSGAISGAPDVMQSVTVTE